MRAPDASAAMASAAPSACCASSERARRRAACSTARRASGVPPPASHRARQRRAAIAADMPPAPPPRTSRSTASGVGSRSIVGRRHTPSGSRPRPGVGWRAPPCRAPPWSCRRACSGVPSTSTRQSWQTPMPQNMPRGGPRRVVAEVTDAGSGQRGGDGLAGMDGDCACALRVGPAQRINHGLGRRGPCRHRLRTRHPPAGAASEGASVPLATRQVWTRSLRRLLLRLATMLAQIRAPGRRPACRVLAAFAIHLANGGVVRRIAHDVRGCVGLLADLRGPRRPRCRCPPSTTARRLRA